MGIGSGTASGFDSAAAGAGQSLSTTSTFSVTAGFDIPQAVDVAVPTSTVTSTETAPVLLAPVTTEPAVAGDQAASAVLSHTPSFASLFENVSETSFQSPDSWVGTEQIGADRGLYTERATALSFDMNGLRFTDLFA
jgi:hypothetical protein